ncbi:MAG: shikimate dehydrogenase [Caldilineaceae bacterium]|nr:shikimate dehydrogenase [Caldilineaceae bacterium]
MENQPRCQQPTFYFIGVTTGQSAAQRIFPQWMAVLQRSEVVLQGVDFRLHDEPARYRQLVESIKADPLALGGLITTHKIDLLAASRDLFDQLDPYAELCDEVSCIAKEGDALVGYAVDPVADGRALDTLLGEGYFERTGGHLLALGAGGAAAALALHILHKPQVADRPRHFTLVDMDAERLAHIRAIVEKQPTDIQFHYHHHHHAAQNDALLANLPPASVIINATGLGKDRPGSPLTDQAEFPLLSIAWELNYRGQLDFMHQALRQQAERQLTVADGWEAFLHGWTGVIAHVLGVTITPTLFAELAEVAAHYR